jgi:uncharacterized protein
MPEYLAPAVYVEEVDTGSKPIEGVSTSTAGLLGVAERGPVNTPILITSFGEYRRWFGDLLEIADYSNGSRHHCYLPHAVDGFFTNGGKRVYVTRIEQAGAARAALSLFDRGQAGGVESVLLRSADAGSGTAVNGPTIAVAEATGLNIGETIRIGDGSRSEYRKVALVSPSLQVPLQGALSHAHPQNALMEVLVRTPTADALHLSVDVPPGATTVHLAGADVGNVIEGQFLEFVELAGSPEYRFVSSIGALDTVNQTVDITLDAPLFKGYAQPLAIVSLDPFLPVDPAGPKLQSQASAGDASLFASSVPGTFSPGTFIRIDGAQTEIRSIGAFRRLDLQQGAYDNYPANARVELVGMAPQQFNVSAMTGAVLSLDSVKGLLPGQSIVLDPAGSAVVHVIQSVDATVTPPTITLTIAPAAQPTIAQLRRRLTAKVPIGSTTLALGNRVGVAAGDLLRLGPTGADEYVIVRALLGTAGSPPNAGTVVLEAPTQLSHESGDDLTLQVVTASTGIPVVSVSPTSRGSTHLLVTEDPAAAASGVVRVQLSAARAFYHTIVGDSALAPQEITLESPLDRHHEAGAPTVQRDAQIAVTALDTGIWGNRLRISIEDQRTGLVSGAKVTGRFGTNQITLTSPTGVEPGTVLEMLDDQPVPARIGPLMKVREVDRNTGRITLDSPLDPSQVAAVPGKPRIRSIEFQLTVRLMRRADALVPSRDDTVVQMEEFRNLSMDSRHSRYFQSVIGDGKTGAPIRMSDGRPEGSSWFVRVEDLGSSSAQQEIRSGPETLVDIMPNGTPRPARHALSGGDDLIAQLSDADYIGSDDVDPSKRTGLYALRNIDEISIVAVPGQTGVDIQGALIAHCELMRYRFAVLDGPEPPKDLIADVRAQRQQFDTRYAALYHPWLHIPQPFPSPIAAPVFSIPPSGQVMGVYARTDIERGVHKAPANEVVRGVSGVNQQLSQSEQDILNPYPVNINVIRDFRKSNRGIRVWGARVITSDSDWKYVNVRRLMIFLEASIDRGLQWVVFEPNAEPLWARVRRTISNFLRVVWRNGALEGAKVEEAFFVRCDRSTMTQAEIDNGQLIVLIGVAPVKPAEFVIIRIGLWTAHTDD